MKLSLERIRAALIDLAVASLLIGALLIKFEVSLVFLDTNVAGGDMVSHPLLVRGIRRSLELGQLHYWNHDWFGGYPFLYFYFYPIYLLAALLTILGLPLTIAFKLTVLLTLCSVPLFSYLGFKCFLRRGTAAACALMVVTLVLDESHSHWGGNVKSLLAGQISHLLGLACLPLLIGMLYSRRERETLTVVTLTLAALSHVFTAIFAGLIWVIALVLRAFEGHPVRALIRVALVSLALTAFWWLPFFYYRDATAAPIQQSAPSFSEVFQLLKFTDPFFFLMYLLVALSLYISFRDRIVRPWSLSLFAVCIATALSLPFLAQTPVLPIRLLPQLFFLLPVILALCLSSAEKIWSSSYFQAFIVTIALFIYSGRVNANPQWFLWSMPNYPIREAPDWWDWNMAGVEQKADFSELEPILKALSTINDGRVAAEYGDYRGLGSPRFFETLPLNTGTPIIEGLLLESASSNAFYYYAMRKIHGESWWPGFKIQLPKRDVVSGIKDLAVYDVRYFIASSADVRESLRSAGMAELVASEKFSLFHINSESRLVSRIEGNIDVQFVKSPLYASIAALPLTLKRQTILRDGTATEIGNSDVQTQNLAPLNSEWSPDGQTLTIPSTGGSSETPVKLLIKVPYFPNWRSDTGERVELITPNLMSVMTTAPTITLRYRPGLPEGIGLAISAMAAIYLLLSTAYASLMVKGHSG